MSERKDSKESYLKEEIRHVDIAKINSTAVIDAMRHMSFSARDLARACDIFEMALADKDCTTVLSLAGSTSAGGCMQLYADLIKYNMIDVVVATGASIVDMDFFEALGFKHYRGSPAMDDRRLRELYIDRIYDTLIDEEQLQVCDQTVKAIADELEARPYSSREFIREMGRWLTGHAKKRGSLLETAFQYDVPVFCPAFSDSSAGFGLVLHQAERPEKHLSIDSVRDFRELTDIKIHSGSSALLIIGGGVPKNFIQDTVICAEVLGKNVPMHKYAVQITVADVRDGACSSSTLKEASSWGKVDTTYEQMVYAEATLALPLLASYSYHKGAWRSRPRRQWGKLFEGR